MVALYFLYAVGFFKLPTLVLGATFGAEIILNVALSLVGAALAIRILLQRYMRSRQDQPAATVSR